MPDDDRMLPDSVLKKMVANGQRSMEEKIAKSLFVRDEAGFLIYEGDPHVLPSIPAWHDWNMTIEAPDGNHLSCSVGDFLSGRIIPKRAQLAGRDPLWIWWDTRASTHPVSHGYVVFDEPDA